MERGYEINKRYDAKAFENDFIGEKIFEGERRRMEKNKIINNYE